jgi:hypothetical protein
MNRAAPVMAMVRRSSFVISMVIVLNGSMVGKQS